MSVRKRVTILVISLLPLQVATASQCDYPQKDLVLNGNTGQILSAKSWFPGNKAVTYLVRHENPFKYGYTHAATFKPTEQTPAINQFLGTVIPDFDRFKSQLAQTANLQSQGDVKLKFTEQSNNGNPEPDPEKDKKLTSQCKTSNAIDDLHQAITQHENFFSSLVAESSTFNGKTLMPFSANVGLFNRDIMTANSLRCETALETAGKIKQSVDTFTKEYADYSAMVVKFEKTLNALNSKHSGIDANKLDAACRQVFNNNHNKLNTLTTTYGSMKPEIAKLDTANKTAKAVGDTLSMGLAHGFYSEGIVPARRQSGTATVNITRTNRQPGTDKTQAVLESKAEITIGRPFFSLSAGLGVSSIDERVFGRTKSLQDDGMGNTALVDTLSLVDESSPSVLGVLMLHANLGRYYAPGTGFGASPSLSLGATFGDGEDASALGFLFGLSLTAFDDAFFITAGYHVRDVKQLAPGFSVGDVVPEGLEAVAPTVSRSDEGLMLVLSYKFQ